MTSVTYLGNFLSEHGLNPTYSEALVPQLSRQGLSVKAASRRLNPAMRLFDMAGSVLRAPKKDSVVIVDLCSGPRAFPAAYALCLLSKASGKPYVLVLHGGNLPSRLSRSRTQLVRMLTGAARVVSPSSYLAETFSGCVRVDVIPNAVDVPGYPFRNRPAPLPNFLYLRAFHRLYGPLTALRAFSIVRGRYPHARLTMVGPDEDGSLAECRSLVDRLGLGPAVEFIGRVPKAQIPGLGDRCDIFLNPAFVDNTPVSTVEAMAMGLPIVATTAGGLPHLLTHGETALLVPPGDENRMAGAMLRLLEEPGLAERVSRNARMAAERMDWTEVTPKWLELIRSVVQQTA